MKRQILSGKKLSAVLAALVFCTLASPLFAEYNSFGIPDSTSIRKNVKSSWLTAPFSEIRSKAVEIRENADGQVFQLRLEEGMDEFSVIVSPQSFLDVEVVTETKREKKLMEVYPVGAPGSFILYRNKTNGKPLRILWYFNPDAEVYIQLRPDESKTFADLIVFGSYAARSVPVGIPFEQFYTMTFQNLYNVTQKILPWEKVHVIPGQYLDSLQMVAVIRELLPKIDYVEEACYNEKNELYSFITNEPLTVKRISDEKESDKKEERLLLSSQGFLKWIIDGVTVPNTGKNTKIEDLERQTVTYSTLGKSGILSQKWNLSFSLDWTRNLAAEALSARSTREYSWEDGNVDVKVEPFAAEVINGQLVNSVGYLKDTGYSAKKLKSLLYVLGITEPQYFYLAAIRQQSTIAADEMVFNDCAVLFPFFDDTGRFGCYVFENGREMTLETFCAKYANSFVHLVRVKSEESFFPKGAAYPAE